MINRVGEQKKNNYGSLMTIVEYKNSKDITVEFEDGYRVKAQYGQFKKGNIVSLNDKTLYKVGYIGCGEYRIQKDGKCTPAYVKWKHMLGRCYNEEIQSDNRCKTYKNCTVCEEWHNFQNFAKWFDENYYECDEELNLDKDILIKNNRVYSPETCILVPQRINQLFVRQKSTRGDYPIGVNYHKRDNVFRAYCSVFDKDNKKFKQKHLGNSKTPEDAFLKYKTFKEEYIKQVAEEYKDRIPSKLYYAMINYIVEIHD